MRYRVSSVTIRVSNTMLEVSPAFENILSEHLTYEHQVHNYTQQAAWNQRQRVFTAVKLYFIQDEKLYANRGMLDRVSKVLTNSGINITYDYTAVVNNVGDADFSNITRRIPDLKLRAGQDRALGIIATQSHGQFEAPTGWGKTTIMGIVCAMYPKARIMICTPGLQLLSNTVSRLRPIFGMEVGECSGSKSEKGRIIVTTYGSLKKATTLLGNPADIILVDECHKAAAPEFSNTLAEITGYSKIFGFTATPEGRSDNAELVTEALLGPVVFRVGYNDMVEAGAVCPMQVAVISTSGIVDGPFLGNTDSQVSKKRHGYWRNKKRNKLIATTVKEIPKQYGLPEDAQTLILVETIEHANNLASLLPEFAVIHGERDSQLAAQGIDAPTCGELREQFESGKLRKAIATGMWGTGVDFVQLDVLIHASGAPSHITTTQWAGRNSRIRKDKSFGLLVDYSDHWDTWTAGRALRRFATYRKHKWKIQKISINAVQTDLPAVV